MFKEYISLGYGSELEYCSCKVYRLDEIASCLGGETIISTVALGFDVVEKELTELTNNKTRISHIEDILFD